MRVMGLSSSSRVGFVVHLEGGRKGGREGGREGGEEHRWTYGEGHTRMSRLIGGRGRGRGRDGGTASGTRTKRDVP